jgi:hypothetical protein
LENELDENGTDPTVEEFERLIMRIKADPRMDAVIRKGISEDESELIDELTGEFNNLP